MKPISIQEVDEAKGKSFPDFVIEAFNNMIVENWNGSSSKINQEDVMVEILRLANDNTPSTTTRSQVLNNGWLDVENTYRREGWVVKYDRPLGGESYHAYFIFSRK
jgi:hypothetical protein